MLSPIRRMMDRRQQIVSLKSMLSNGSYYYTFTDKHIFFRRTSVNEKMITNSYRKENKPSIIFQIKILIFNLFPLEIKNSIIKDFSGEIIMFSRSGDVKIFDTQNGFLRTIINDHNRFRELTENIDKANYFFNTPVLEINRDYLYIEEKIINFKNYKKLNNNDIYKILSDYIKNMQKIYEGGHINVLDYSEMMDTFSENFSMIDSYSKFVKYNCNFIELKKTNCYYMHGDLNFNNILKSEDSIYYIDFEDATYSFIYYDLINLFFVEALFHNNFIFLDSFLEGEFDYMFSKELLINEKKIKLAYVELYVIERLNKFEIKNRRNNFEEILESYLLVLDHIK